MSANPIRTLFVSHDSSLYGAQQSLLGLLAHLDPDLIESYVVTPYAGDLGRELEKLRIPVYVRPITHWVVSAEGVRISLFQHFHQAIRGLRSRVDALVDLIQKHSIDIVYTNTVTCIDGALAARAAKRPHVWHLREQVAGNRDLKSLLPVWLTNRIVATLSDQIITNSNALKDHYVKVAPPDRVAVVYNGIDLESFSPGPPRYPGLREELSLPPGTKLVAIVGSISPRKGHTLLAEAAALIKRTFNDVEFLVIGAGQREFVNAVKVRVEQLGVGSCFHFLGWRSDIPDILRASDVLVVASDQEPFGRTVVEAMATELPVVATRCGGPEEIIVDRQTGLLVPINDPRAMADAVRAIIGDAVWARSLGRAGRRRAEACFSVQAYVAVVQDILRQVAASAHKSTAQTGIS